MLRKVMTRRTIHISTVTVAAALIVGCTTPTARFQSGKTEHTKEIADQSVRDVNAIEREFVKDSNVVRVAGRSFKIKKRTVLPAAFDRPVRINMETPTEYSEIIRRIQVISGLPIKFTVDALANIGTIGASSIEQRANDIKGEETAKDQERREKELAMQNGTASNLKMKAEADTAFPSFEISYQTNGSLKDALDAITNLTHLSWRWHDDKQYVEVYKYDTATFQIDTLPGIISHSGQLSTSVSSDEDGASTSSRYVTSVDVKTPEIWEVLQNGVKAVMSPGGKLVISPLTGTVTVTDTPRVLEEVEAVVDDYNVRLAQTIMYKVDIVEVARNHVDSTQLSFSNLLFNDSGNYSWELASGLNVLPNAASALTGTVLKPSSKFNGTQALLSNISQKAEVVSHRTVFTTSTNGVTTPVQEVREITFLAAKSTTVNGDTSQQSLEPGVTSEGFSIFLTGMLTSSGGLMLQTSIDLATLEELVKQGTEEEFIQGPITQKKNALTRNKIKAGDTVLAALVERTIRSKDQNGLGHFKNLFTGGANLHSSGRIVTMVLVTPYFKA